jgi:hypothetical protein
MRKTARSIFLVFLTLLSAVVLGVTTILTSAGLSLAETTVTALIMGGSGTPDPDQEPGYVPNVSSYYIFPNSACQPKPDNCTLQSVVTPEEAWPLYGGLTALTWKQSILTGVEIYDAAVRAQLQTDDTNVVLFGYSQSGAILAIEKRALEDDPTIPQDLIDKLQIVVIGNVSRPNGGLNGRLPGFTLPIVEFPFGPTMPTDTTIETTDIALKWDIIADAPLYVLNPLAMLNALLGGPGFGINHGTYPNPEGVPPTGLVGGYTQEEWQTIMRDPAAYAALHPDVVNVQRYGDTTYITVTPKVLPLLVPLHTIGLGFVADLIEPALRVIIEETGYDRSIPYGEPTPFQLFPVFDPIKLAVDVLAAIPEGIAQALANLGVTTTLVPTTPAPTTNTFSTLAAQSGPAETSNALTATDSGTVTEQVSEPTTSTSTSTEKVAQKGDESVVQKTDVETESSASKTDDTSVTKPEDTTTPETTKPATTKPEEGTTKREEKKGSGEKKEADETKKDASGGSVSLIFSPKKSTKGETSGATAGQDDTAGTESPTSTDSEAAA